jgi:hypothetical protein
MFGSGSVGQHGWILRTDTVNGAGHVLSSGGAQLDLNYLATRCHGLALGPGELPSKFAMDRCLHKLGIHPVQSYQPDSRFWAFQGIESAIYVALAAVLLLVAACVVRRRLA